MGAEECKVVIAGNDALASIDRYDISIPSQGKTDTSVLRRRVEAACTLTNYRSLSLGQHEQHLPDSALTPIVAFHENIRDNMWKLTPEEIAKQTKKIGELLQNLADAVGVPDY